MVLNMPLKPSLSAPDVAAAPVRKMRTWPDSLHQQKKPPVGGFLFQGLAIDHRATNPTPYDADTATSAFITDTAIEDFTAESLSNSLARPHSAPYLGNDDISNPAVPTEITTMGETAPNPQATHTNKSKNSTGNTFTSAPCPNGRTVPSRKCIPVQFSRS